MSQEKAQLIAPLGHFTVPGLNVSGVVTATSFSGNCTGTASSIAKGTNVVVGVMTASSFVGDVTGNVTGIGSNTDNLDVGVVTATSFAGNFTGIGSGLTGTPNVVAGVVTATKFVGNTPGTVSKLADGTNINVGVVTATKFVGNTSGLAAGIAAAQNINVGVLTATGGLYGDGSGLTGAGTTAYIRQTVGSGTTIDLNNGNIILFEHVGDTTVSFANTSTADDVTFIRPLTDPTDISISTGGVTFDRVGDYLSFAGVAIGTNDFTIEAWIYPDGGINYPCIVDTRTAQGGSSGFFWGLNSSNRLYVYTGGSDRVGGTVTAGEWSHVALVRDYSLATTTMYINGISVGSWGGDNYNYSNDLTKIGFSNISGGAEDFHWDGKISNVRVVVGRVLYTTDFYPPSAELTNVADTKLLCCQSDSSTTAAAVIPSGSITANGDPTAGAETLTLSPSLGSAITWPAAITWNGGYAPTLATPNSEYYKQAQVFNLITADGGITWYGYEEANAKKFQYLTMWSSGEVTQWFNDSYPTNRSSPVQIPGIWKMGSAGEDQGQGGGIKNDGTLWIWGSNYKGTLGQNQSPSGLPGLASPKQVGSDTDWSSYEGAYYTNWAIKTDGTLWGIGGNDYGQLGQNGSTNADRSSPVQVPGTTWDTVRGGKGRAVFATKTDGTLWAWGGNTSGMLGQNLPENSYRSSPVQIPGNTWKTGLGGVAMGQAFGVAIKTNGTMWAWGRGDNGQLGLNQGEIPTTNIIYSSPVQVPGTTWDTVFAGYRFTGALKTDGTLWTWGLNDQAMLGQGNTTQRSSPTQVPGTTWNSLSFHSSASFATKTDNTLWTWGSNPSGVLGQNTVDTTVNSPVQLPGTWKKAGQGKSQVSIFWKAYDG